MEARVAGVPMPQSFIACRSASSSIETEYYVDRKGVYQTGTCAVQCAYSPEFAARTKAIVLSVKR